MTYLLSFLNSVGVTYLVSPSSVSTKIGAVRFFRPGPFLTGSSVSSSSSSSTLTISLSSPEVCRALSDKAFWEPEQEDADNSDHQVELSKHGNLQATPPNKCLGETILCDMNQHSSLEVDMSRFRQIAKLQLALL